MNLAKLFKLPKKLGDSMLISLINNMVDYIRNYDSAIKVDDEGYIHLAADDLYLDGDGSDVDINSDSSIVLNSDGIIQLNSNNNIEINTGIGYDIFLNSNGGVNLISGNESDIQLSSDASIFLNSNNESRIELSSDYEIILNSDNEGGIHLNSDGEINLNSDNQYSINLNSGAEIYLTSNGAIEVKAYSSDITLETADGDYNRKLILWSDSDGLSYSQDGDTYFQINEDGACYISNENGGLIYLQENLPKEATKTVRLSTRGIPEGSNDYKILIETRFMSEIFNINHGYDEDITISYDEYNPFVKITMYKINNILTDTEAIFINNTDNNSEGGAWSRNDTLRLTCIENVGDITEIIASANAFCYTADTLITLADGSTKQVKDITYDDELKVWNFDEGKDDVAKPLWIKRTEYAKSYQLVTLSDGNTIKLCGTDGKYHCMFDVTEQKFNHAVDCIGHEVYTENGIATVVSIEEVKEKVDHYNIVTNYHMNLYANHILTSTEKNNIYPIADMKFVKDDRKIVPYEEFEKAHISREYYDGWRAGEWSEPLKDVITHLRRRKMYAKPQKRVKDGLRTDYFG